MPWGKYDLSLPPLLVEGVTEVIVWLSVKNIFVLTYVEGTG
jgi:hypothetical protein